MNEFSLIDHYFKHKTCTRRDVVLGIGDDGALLKTSSDMLMVVSMDTLVAGVHFPLETMPYDIGYKALAVNVSDLAAMGAAPAWFTLALTMPSADNAWLDHFSNGLFDMANQFDMQLIGGDTTRGPLTITIQAHGFVPHEKSLRRSGAKPGDKIYVSGTLGDAGLGLLVAMNQLTLPAVAREYVLRRLHRPEPRMTLGLLLREFATSAIDISDGLLADLQHILTASQVGAVLNVDAVPLSTVLRDHLPAEKAMRLALTAGDDYELCFTVPPILEKSLQDLLAEMNISCTCIGVITENLSLKLNGQFIDHDQKGYLHF